MFKNESLPTTYGSLHMQPKCGEIYYRNELSFVLVCCVCDMKLFGFEDFVRHIRNVHEFFISNKPHDTETPLKDLLKEEPEFQECQTNDCNLENEDAGNPQHLLSFNEDIESSDNNKDVGDEAENVSINNVLDWSFKKDIVEVCDEMDSEEESVENMSDDSVQYRVMKTQKARLPKEYKCVHCNRLYTTDKYLNMHIKLKHLSPKPFPCDQCKDTFNSERALDSHRQKVHIGYPCELCKKVYKHKELLRRHLQRHTGERSYQCDFENCAKSFVTAHALGQHRRTHLRERNYVCEICGYRCRYKEALTVHRRSHTGEKPYVCQTCKRAFASKSLLNEHQAMHSTERPYKCETCSATFSRPKALYHHKHLHLAVKKFVCKICGNAYAQASGLSAHMRSHKIQSTNSGSMDASTY